MREVGPLFDEILRLKKLEKKTLAKEIGVSPQQIGVLLKQGADKWKLSYFELACKFLNVHPKSFFDNWNEPGNVINGNVENTAILGNSTFTIGNERNDSALARELQDRIKDKEDIISSLKEIIKLQQQLLRNCGFGNNNFLEKSIDD